MKTPLLYHGSGKKIKILVPKQARDLRKNKENSLRGVYASSWRKWAILMGILGCKGVKRASTHITGKNKIDAVIHSGYPKQTYFYLYELPSTNFKNIPRGSPQWVSSKPVKPIKIEKLKVKDYIHFINKNGPDRDRTGDLSHVKGSS